MEQIIVTVYHVMGYIHLEHTMLASPHLTKVQLGKVQRRTKTKGVERFPSGQKAGM